MIVSHSYPFNGKAGFRVNAIDWTQWLPLIAVWIALLGMWGAMQHRLGRLEARMDALESRMDKFQEEQREARAENIRLHEETRAEIRRDIRPPYPSSVPGAYPRRRQSGDYAHTDTGG